MILARWSRIIIILRNHEKIISKTCKETLIVEIWQWNNKIQFLPFLPPRTNIPSVVSRTKSQTFEERLTSLMHAVLIAPLRVKNLAKPPNDWQLSFELHRLSMKDPCTCCILFLSLITIAAKALNLILGRKLNLQTGVLIAASSNIVRSILKFIRVWLTAPHESIQTVIKELLHCPSYCIKYLEIWLRP